MLPGSFCTEADGLVAHIQQHEAQLWSLIDAQHELRSRIDGLNRDIVAKDSALMTLLSSIGHIIGQYELGTWQTVNAQLRLRLKFMEFRDVGRDWMVAQETTVDSAEGVKTVDEGTVDSGQALIAHARDGREQDQKSSCPDGTETTLREQHMHHSHSDQCTEPCNTPIGLNNHKMTRHDGERPFECDICHGRFGDRRILRRHMETHAAGRLVCNYCGRAMSSKLSLSLHIKFTHASAQSDRQFLCDECGKAFLDKSVLKQHMLVHSAERPFTCSECDYRCVKAAYLKVHMRTHSSVGPAECPSCRKSFASVRSLYNHQRRMHPADRPYECSYCDKKFGANEHLQSHLRRHTGAPKCACGECGEQFRSFSQRTLHMRTEHTGERPYQCDMCDERFFIKAAMTRHLIKHSGVKPFACSECATRCSSAGALSRHQQIQHSDRPPVFRCDICLREFAVEAILARHRRSHTGEKPFSCKVCQKAFADSHSVKVHTRIHTGEMPYACAVCDRRFRDKSNMRKHAKMHSK